MTKLLPKELVQAREFMDQAKLDEALEIIEQFEKTGSLSSEDQLSALLMKGRVYLYKQRTRKALQCFEGAYQMSQDLELVAESISALIGKAYILPYHVAMDILLTRRRMTAQEGVELGDLGNASSYVTDAEERLKTLADDPSTVMLRRNLLLIKSWIFFFKGNFNGAAELAQECLKLTIEKKLGNKLDLAITFLLLGWINLYQGNRTKALDYAMKSIEHNKGLNHAVALADDYYLIAAIYYFEGDYDQALQYGKQSLSIKEISKRNRLGVLGTLGQIYILKGKLNRAVKYRQQAVALAEELNITDQLILNLIALGYLYRMMGKINLAIESIERSLTLSEKWGLIFLMAQAIALIIITYIDENSREKANRYFSRLSKLYNQTKEKRVIDISFWYLASKAFMMKSSTRMRDRVEAQALFKELIDSLWFANYQNQNNLILCLGNLCDLLLEELSMYNDPAILDEIYPLITKCLEMAEEAHNYSWLAEAKLLQAKLALIQMNIEEAKRLMVEAQRIADLHGLNLLAWGISSEHDKLLDQIDDWDTIKKKEAPMSERIKLASPDGVLERIQGRHALEPPKSVDEQSTVLLILGEGGVLIFSYPFSNEWKVDEDLFSSFLSAFTSFSSEFFSKELDRVKFGDEMMLLESIGSFSFCYLFKGQTYFARQKLTKFIEEVQKNTFLWQRLEQHYKSSQILELKESPQLESLITETFISPKLLESNE